MTLLNASCACELVIFGTRGDLARRKLLPSLLALERRGLLHEQCRITGVGRVDWSLQTFKLQVEQSLLQNASPLAQQVMPRLLARLNYQRVDLTVTDQYAALCRHLSSSSLPVIFYFAIPPDLVAQVCHHLAAHQLIQSDTRVVLEKPIGHSLESCQLINQQVAACLSEQQVYRIDHYLGKETVQNLLVLRFANDLFANCWDHRLIDHVQITVAESVGIEGRWGYYDQAGQMRDMVQNHLLQLLSLIAMEPPSKLDAESIRTEKCKVLKALRPITANDASKHTVRGQYTGGYIIDSPVAGYLEEDGATAKSQTETFVALRVDIDNWRWAGVPFFLRTGKRLPQKRTEILIQFKCPVHNLFGHQRQLAPNQLLIRLEPDEKIQLQMMNKVPGLDQDFSLQATHLDLTFSQAFAGKPLVTAYERLLLEVMQGNQALFVHKDEIEAAWHWVDGVLTAWQRNRQRAKPYPAGSWGPVDAVALMARFGRHWLS